MILGIILVIWGILMSFIFGLIWDRVELGIFLMFCCIIGGAVLISSPLVGPDYHKAPYSIEVEGQQYYFDDYNRYTEKRTTVASGMLAMDFNEVIVIPSHFYKKIGFINSWEYCDVLMKIDIPHGSDLVIENHTPKPVPHIVEEGCK